MRGFLMCLSARDLVITTTEKLHETESMTKGIGQQRELALFVRYSQFLCSFIYIQPFLQPQITESHEA